MAQSILSNTAIASAGRIVSIAIGIAITAALTRLLGAAGYGAYALLISFGLILQIAADFGLYLTLTSEIAEHPRQQQALYSHIASLRIALLITFFTIGIIAAAFIPRLALLIVPLIIISLGLAFQSLSQLFMGIYQAHSVVWRATLGDLAGRLAQLGLVVGAPLFISQVLPPAGSRLAYFAFAFTASAAIAYGLHSLLLPAVNPWRLRIHWQQWKSIARHSWPLGALLILNIVYFRVDIIMLSFWHPDTTVGYYGLAYRIIESTLFFPAMFGGLLLPQIRAFLTAKKKHAAERLLSQSLGVMAVMAPLASLMLIVFAHPIVRFLSGPDYGPAAPMLQVLSFAMFAMFIGNIFGFALISLKKQKQLLLLYVGLVVVNITANAIFIPAYGGLAAAATTVLTEALAMMSAGYIVFRSLPFRIPPWQIIGSIIMVIATAAIALRLPSDWHILYRLIIASATYLAGSFALGLTKKSHLHLLMQKQPGIL